MIHICLNRTKFNDQCERFPSQQIKYENCLTPTKLIKLIYLNQFT